MARLIRTIQWAHDAAEFVGQQMTAPPTPDLNRVAMTAGTGPASATGTTARRRIAERRVEIQARSEERRRISRLLHDEIGQSLTAVNVKLAIIRARASAAAKAELLSAQQLLEATMDQVQRLSRELHPSTVEDLGLVAAVRSHLKALSERSAITLSLKAAARSLSTLDAEVGVVVFRSIEFLLASLEHSAAHSAQLTLALEHNELCVDTEARMRAQSGLSHHQAEPIMPDFSDFEDHVLAAGGSVRFRIHHNHVLISARFPASAGSDEGDPSNHGKVE
jgi:signal transduction histidine kinase